MASTGARYMEALCEWGGKGSSQVYKSLKSTGVAVHVSVVGGVPRVAGTPGGW